MNETRWSIREEATAIVHGIDIREKFDDESRIKCNFVRRIEI